MVHALGSKPCVRVVERLKQLEVHESSEAYSSEASASMHESVGTVLIDVVC